MGAFLVKKTPIYLGNRVVGEVRDTTFCKRVKGSKHFLHTPRAIAFDVTTLEDAETAGAVWVEITDEESGKIYHAPIDEIHNSGFALNRGYGEQVALPLSKWHTKREARQLAFAMA